jgi:mono/diheme cytochrome c family protein
LRIYSVLLLAATLIASACSGGKDTADSKTYRSMAVIKAVETKDNKLTIDHEDIPGFMAPMTMTWPVSDPAMLAGLKAGDKVEFEIIRNGSDVTITKCVKVGETKIIDGAAIFAANCAVCHGAKGEGEKRGIPLISGHALDHSEKDFIERVRNGKESRMLPFRDKLSEDEIAAVVTYVRTVLQAGLVGDPKEGHKH